ncbi:TRAP transporter small permease [Phaeovulum sp. W22_SRMD_FR3]|uniref:TRAP transporter small permease n=1 Tax=Phaeovulum sp. W22_SRMD_FR3 TaxID=3240274 RepID=UPI003F97DE48
MAADAGPAAPPPAGLVPTLITGWALLGGAMLLAVVAVNVVSVVGAIFGAPFPGDFELTEMGVANAAFAFLPYCQLTRSNVTADIFTQNAGPRMLASLRLMSSLVALLFGLLLLWRMYAGLLDQKQYNYETSILQLPIWMAFVPILVSLALLSVSAAITLAQDLRDLSRKD